MGWESLPCKDRCLAKGFPLLEHMKNLLLPFGGELKDLYLARDEHIKANPLIPLGKDDLASLIGTIYRYAGQLIVVLL